MSTQRAQEQAEYDKMHMDHFCPLHDKVWPVRCQLENDCGQPMHPGGEGGCKLHETAAWISALQEEEDEDERAKIIARLLELDWVAK